MDIRAALITGIDIPIPECQLILYQPSIKELSYLGEDNLFSAIHLLCLEKEQLIEDKNILSQLNNFQVLMKVIQQTEMKDKKQCIIDFFNMIFPQEQCLITPNNFIFRNRDTGEAKIIDDNNFSFLQENIKQVFSVNSLFQGNNVVYKPANEAARKIADKIMKGRQKVAMQKNSGNNSSIIAQYISILSIAIPLPINICASYTLYQLLDQMERYTLYTEWNSDFQIRLAGGSPNSEPENWMKSIH